MLSIKFYMGNLKITEQWTTFCKINAGLRWF